MPDDTATASERGLAAEVVRLAQLAEYWKQTATTARALADGHAETLREVKKALGLNPHARRREIVDTIRIRAPRPAR
jgi:hypothetical protein